MTYFSKALKTLRIKAGLSQQELAKILQISNSAISMYERGEREPDFKTLISIANYFNVTTDYLITGNIGFTFANIKPTNELYENIKAIREENKISTKELAEILHRPEKLYIDCENGKFNFTPDDVSKLSRYFKIPYEDLYGATFYRRRTPPIEFKYPEKLAKKIATQNSVTYFLKILEFMYGKLECRTTTLSNNNPTNYYLVGENKNQFVLYEEDIYALYKSICAFLPIIIERMKQPPEL